MTPSQQAVLSNNIAMPYAIPLRDPTQKFGYFQEAQIAKRQLKH